MLIGPRVRVNETILAIGTDDYPFIHRDVFSDARDQILMPGIEYETFRTFAQLAGFENYKIIPAYDKEYGQKINGTWNGMIKMLLDGEAHMTLSFLSYTEERASVVDFGPPLYYFRYGAATKTPEYEPLKFVLLKPLQESVWILFFLSFFAVTTIFVLLSAMAQKYIFKEQNREKRLHIVMHNVWVSISSTLQQGVMLRTDTVAYCFIFCLWHLALLVLVQTYTGVLMSFLTTRAHKELPFKDLDSFADALLAGRYRLIDEGEELIRDKIISNTSSYMKILRAVDLYRPREFPVKDEEDFKRMFDEIRADSGLAYFGADFYITNATEHMCDITITPFDSDNRWMSFVFPKNSPYKKLFSEKLAGASAFVYELQKKYIHKQKCNPSAQEIQGALSFTHIAELVWLTLAGLACAGIVFATEIILFRKGIKLSIVSIVGKSKKKKTLSTARLYSQENETRSWDGREPRHRDSWLQRYSDLHRYLNEIEIYHF